MHNAIIWAYSNTVITQFLKYAPLRAVGWWICAPLSACKHYNWQW